MPVLDASAVLALILKEPGYENVPLGGTLSSVNFAEVIAKLASAENAKTLEADLALLGIEIKPFNTSEACLAGELRSKTKSLGLSLGDRACLAVASLLGEDVITADKIWAKLTIDVKIRLIR